MQGRVCTLVKYTHTSAIPSLPIPWPTHPQRKGGSNLTTVGYHWCSVISCSPSHVHGEGVGQRRCCQHTSNETPESFGGEGYAPRYPYGMVWIGNPPHMQSLPPRHSHMVYMVCGYNRMQYGNPAIWRDFCRRGNLAI